MIELLLPHFGPFFMQQIVALNLDDLNSSFQH